MTAAQRLPRVDIGEPARLILHRLGFTPKQIDYVGHIDIWPTETRVTVYRGSDGAYQGRKYLGGDGEPAIDVLRFATRVTP